MAAEVADPEVAARATLALLETRLHRLEFLLTGKTSHHGIPAPSRKPNNSDDTIWAKLDTLEAELGDLKKLSGPAGAVLRDIDQLCMQGTSTCE